MLGDGDWVCLSVAGSVGMVDRTGCRWGSAVSMESEHVCVVDDLDMDWQWRRGRRFGVFRIARQCA